MVENGITRRKRERTCKAREGREFGETVETVGHPKGSMET